MWGGAHRNYLSQSLIIKLSQSLGTPVPIAAKFHCAGFLMAFISLKPMMAFQQFDKSMTNGGLIVAICSAIGFAAVISYTKCDVHLVTLLTRPLKN